MKYRQFLLSSIMMTVMALLLSFASCAGDDGSDGADGQQGPSGLDGEDGQPGISVGTLEVMVTNALSGSGESGVGVAIDPDLEGVSITTGSNGAASVELPIGSYALTLSKEGFESAEAEVTLVAGESSSVEVDLDPTAPVLIDLSMSGDASPGGTITATASVTVLDGSTVSGVSWAQSNSVDVSLSGAGDETVTATLPDLAAFKGELIHILTHERGALGEDGEHIGVLVDRFQVLGFTPLDLEEAGHVALEATVSTSTGDYSATLDIHADLPFGLASNTGIRNVPVGLPVLLSGKDQASYDWNIDNGTLSDADTRFPHFVPASKGTYNVTATDLASGQPVTLTIHAGEWAGAISGQNADGTPQYDNCSGCHDSPEMFSTEFEEWSQSGHAEIFSVNINTSTHYSTGCFDCHTVGFNAGVDNGGIDDAADYGDFIEADLFHHVTMENWSTVLSDFGDTASLANIQCENCHGPNSGPGHMSIGDEDSSRFSLGSEVCGSCHGEPPRHGRFQQWQESSHANYALAIDESQSGSCSVCHTANGFIAAMGALEADDDYAMPGSVSVSWSEDEAHPQTCAACHDPHAQGTTSGEPNTATLRIMEDSPLVSGGFRALGVGNGALCIACHNSRRGLRNDHTMAGQIVDSRATHGGPQGDVLMGQNMYFVSVPDRSPHSFIENTCTNCHMVRSDPPEEFSYNYGGTNHTFEADLSICSSCHGEFEATGVIDATESTMHLLEEEIVKEVQVLIAEAVGEGKTVALEDGDGTVATLNGKTIQAIHLTESHGRCALDIDADGVHYSHVRYSDLTANGTSIFESPAGQVVQKATWNYFIAHSDGSEGIHNPGFILGGLTGALNALEEGPLDETD